MDVAKATTEDFVTVVSVGSQPTSENFVTVLSIGNGKKSDAGESSVSCKNEGTNGMDGHLEEEVEIFRLPGERLGFGLKFEGGNKTSERVRRLFVQSCAEQSPASRAKCSWGALGEGDEVLSIDSVPVTHMTRLDCVRRLKESQLVIRLMVRCRGALRPEVVSAERKIERNKVPPELPAAPPPVPPRKLRQPRGPADGEANPSPVKKSWDSPKSPASQTGSAKVSSYESCESSPRSINGSSHQEMSKESPKNRSPEFTKSKQEPPEAMVYLDARSQCGSTHGSTSDDTGSSMSTVMDRFSTMSDRVSTISTTSTASTTGSEQPSELAGVDRDPERSSSDRDVLLSRAICPLEMLERDFTNPPDYLLRRLANSEAVTHVESRGEVERITAVVAPNTVLIEETITLQPPLSFQDAPLSYGHEARPDLFYTADLAADSTTHFRPIKDDVELVERVNGSVHEEMRVSGTERSNGIRLSPPPLPARNHVNRICVNQTSESGNDARISETVPVSPEKEPSEAPLLPPKPLPRKDVKARRKRPPPPPPPPIITPRREIKSSPSIESNHLAETEDVSQVKSAECVKPGLCDSLSKNNVFQNSTEISTEGFENSNGNGDRESNAKNVYLADEKVQTASSSEDTQTNKVLEIIEIRMAKGLKSNQKEEIARHEPNSISETTNCEQNGIKDKVADRNKQDQSQSMNNSIGISTEQNSSLEPTDKHVDESNNEEEKHFDSENLYREGIRTNDDEDIFKEVFPLEDTLSIDNSMLRESEDDETYRSLDEINDDMKNPDVNRMLEEVVEEGDTTDESDDGDYYWQSNLATIGEEEETSLEYVNANSDANDSSKLATEPEESSPAIKKDAFVKNARDDEADHMSEIAEYTEEGSKKPSKNTVNGKMENCGGGQRLPPDGDEFPAAYQEFSNNQPPYNRYIAATRTTATIATNGELCNENETFRTGESFKMLANDSNVVGSRSIILSDSKMTLTNPENVRQDINKSASTNTENVRPEIGVKAIADNACQDNAKSSEIFNEERKSSYNTSEDVAKRNAPTVAGSPLYSCQTTNGNSTMSEKKMEIAGYYHKDAMTIEELPSHVEKDTPVDIPPPLPLTGPPKLEPKLEQMHARNVSTMESPQRKFSLNGDLWRQDDKSERSVRDKIAMFSSQSNLDVPLFPNAMTAAAVTSNGKRLSKYKSSEDVCCDEKNSGQKDRSPFLVDRTQSSFDLTDSARASTGYDSAKKYSQKTPSLPAQPALLSPITQPMRVPKILPVVPPKVTSLSSPYDKQIFSNTTTKNYCAENNNLLNATYPNIGKTISSFNDANNSVKTSTPSLIRATSFSGSMSFVQDRNPPTADAISQIARTNSLASTFRRPGDDTRRSSLNHLIEQRRRSISKLRGLVIPEKDAVPIDQPIVDLPEIKSRDSILLHQVPKANIQDKWGSQSSLASNASTASQPLKATTSFKMPAPQIHSKYSPAFKRKSLTVYGTSVTTSSSSINGNNSMKNSPSSTSTFSEPPKSLESICSPTRSDYSFEFASTTSSPDGSRNRPRMVQRKARLDYDDSDNDSAVSSSQSSISRGFSPPMSPAPSERSTISSERSYISTELNYQRRPLIVDSLNRTSVSRDVKDPISESDKDQFGRIGLLNERTCLTERSSSSSSGGSNSRSPQPNEFFSRNSQIPQRQLKRSNSTDTNCSTSSTLTSGSQASAESLSRRVLKPQSVEAINRKNILASARCRSGRDLNGSPLIQRKFSDDEDTAIENSSTIRQSINDSGNDSASKQEIKIAYIEVADRFAKDEEFFQKKEELKLPPKRSMLPPPAVRPPKPEMLEPSNDLKMWVRAGAKTIERAMEEKSNNKYDKSPPVVTQTLETSPVIHTTRKNHSSMFDEPVNSTLNGGLPSKSKITISEAKVAGMEISKSQSRMSVSPKRNTEDQNDLLTILTTKSRSRSAIHVNEGTFGRSKSQMSLEDILATKADSKLLRAESTEPRIEKNGTGSLMKSTWDSKEGRYCRRGSTTSNESWSEDKPFVSKIPTLGKARNIDSSDEMSQNIERIRNTTTSKIPTSRGLNRRSASVTDMKRALDASPVHSQSQQCASSSHNRFPSLDSSVDENIGTETDVDRCYGEQFGSISSLASSTSLISQQELAQLVEEASLEETRGAHDVVVVLLHKENPTGSVGITLAGGADCEVKEITVHRVLTHSIADKDGRVQRGDRILSINGRSTRGLTHRESMAVLKQPRSEVVLVVSRARIEESCKLRSRTASVETIVEGLETNGNVENTAWGPPSTVAVYKDGAGLGFSLEGGRDSPLGDRPLIIKKIFTGGAAEKTGALKAGDQLLEVNGNDVTRMSRIEAWSLMKKLHDGEVNLLVRHPATKSS